MASAVKILHKKMKPFPFRFLRFTDSNHELWRLGDQHVSLPRGMSASNRKLQNYGKDIERAIEKYLVDHPEFNQRKSGGGMKPSEVDTWTPHISETKEQTKEPVEGEPMIKNGATAEKNWICPVSGCDATFEREEQVKAHRAAHARIKGVFGFEKVQKHTDEILRKVEEGWGLNKLQKWLHVDEEYIAKMLRDRGYTLRRRVGIIRPDGTVATKRVLNTNGNGDHTTVSKSEIGRLGGLRSGAVRRAKSEAHKQPHPALITPPISTPQPSTPTAVSQNPIQELKQLTEQLVSIVSGMDKLVGDALYAYKHMQKENADMSDIIRQISNFSERKKGVFEKLLS